jgi:hypothetical protein
MLKTLVFLMDSKFPVIPPLRRRVKCKDRI